MYIIIGFIIIACIVGILVGKHENKNRDLDQELDDDLNKDLGEELDDDLNNDLDTDLNKDSNVLNESSEDKDIHDDSYYSSETPTQKENNISNSINKKDILASQQYGPYTISFYATEVGHKNRTINKPKINGIRPLPNDYIVIDTETTGLNVKNDKVVQLAALKFENGKLIDTFNEYINPGQHHMSEQATLINGITDAQLKDKPTFDKIVPKFQDFIGDPLKCTFVGHNIKRFDIPILYNNGYRNKGFAPNDFSAIDTYELAKEEMENVNIPNFKLETLKQYFNLEGKSHDALGDCEVNAEVYQKLKNGDLAPADVKTDEILSGLRFCLTGQFQEIGRNDLKRIIELHGGKVTGTVSHKTNYLVDGKQVSKHLKDGHHSNNELKAKEYGIKQISYKELMGMISNNEKSKEK